MASFVIEGGHRLQGDIVPQGAKNEALQIICATLLTSEEVKIYNIPDILDVNNLIQLLRDMGVTVQHIGVNAYSFKADNVNLDYLHCEDFLRRSASLRGSVMIVGPLVARFGMAVIPKPGGDKIGRRRLDTHFIGIQKLGADFTYYPEQQLYEITARELKGAYMLLDEASVTGTANILMAAVLAKGTTTIYNAACEPYLQQLSKMLNKMGAKISGIGSNLLTVEGVESLEGCSHTILPDMIEVGSFIGMAAMTGSDIRIKNVSYNDLGIIPDSFRRLGITLNQEGDDIHVPHHVRNGQSRNGFPMPARLVLLPKKKISMNITQEFRLQYGEMSKTAFFLITLGKNGRDSSEAIINQGGKNSLICLRKRPMKALITLHTRIRSEYLKIG